MTVSVARFYNMRGSLSSGEYPLLAADEDLSEYLISSQTVKYAKGLQTRITVPSFQSYDLANIVEIDGSFYWVTQWMESTTYNESIEFVLDYMGPTSLIRSGDSVAGVFHKTATNECRYLRQDITNGLKLISSSAAPSDLEIGIVHYTPGTGKTDIGFWVQVVGFTVDSGNKRTGIGIRGFVIGVDQDTFMPSEFGVSALDPSGTTFRTYPTFRQLISNITLYTGFQADQIIDCSISKRCPYQFVKTTFPNPSVPSQTMYKVQIKDASGTVMIPDLMTGNIYTYALNNPIVRYSDNSTTVTIDTSSDYSRQCANIEIRDWNENTLMQIPIDADSMTIGFRVHADISGIYTVVSYKDQKITIPEGKLPYIENAWETYKAYQMNGDRQAMENAIKEARYLKETNDLSGMANTALNAVSTGVMTGAIAGNVAGAVTGIASGLVGSAISIWGNQRATELSELKARLDFELSKRRALDQPQSSYNVAYGLIYCALNTLNSLRVCKILPFDVDSEYYDSWCQEYGYPAEGVRTVQITDGYYQGKLLCDSIAKSGMYWDECNKTFMNGFKFIDPGEPVGLNVIYYESVYYYSDQYTNFAFYKNIRLRGSDASFTNTNGQKYRNLMARGAPSSPTSPPSWYMAMTDGTDILTADIELLEADNQYHPASKTTYNNGIVYFTSSDKVFASQTPNDLTELIASRNFELRLIE